MELKEAKEQVDMVRGQHFGNSNGVYGALLVLDDRITELERALTSIYINRKTELKAIIAISKHKQELNEGLTNLLHNQEDKG